MITADNIKTITDIRQKTLSILQYAQKSQEPIFIMHHSKPKGVFLSFEKYQKMVELVEDYLDILEAETILEDKRSKFIPLEKFWKKYKLA